MFHIVYGGLCPDPNLLLYAYVCVWWLQLCTNYAIGEDVEAMKAVVGEEISSSEDLVISALSPILIITSTELPFFDSLGVYILY